MHNPAQKQLNLLSGIERKRVDLEEASKLISDIQQGYQRLWEIAKDLEIDLSFAVDGERWLHVDVNGEEWNSSSAHC